MNYRIETKEAFQMFGLEGVFHPGKENESAPRTPHDLWVQSQANGEYERLFHNAGGLPSYVSPELCRLHGACGYRKTEGDTFPYMLGAFVGPASKTEGYTVVDIPAYTWVIFPSEKGSWDNIGDVIENLYKRVYSEWLPTSGYELMDGVDLEIYGGTDEVGYVELWFPVKQRV
jgi:AraC family transcriptional regulator